MTLVVNLVRQFLQRRAKFIYKGKLLLVP